MGHRAHPGAPGDAAEELPSAEGESGNSDEWVEKIKQMSRMGFICLNVLAV